MKSKFTKEQLEKFPNNLKFVENEKDPLHIIIDAGGIFVSELERDKSRKIDNLFIDKGNPVEPSGVYFIDIGTNINNIEIIPSGDAGLVETGVKFLDNNVTGFELLSEISPTGVPNSGILGVSYGFDWDDPEYYLTSSGMSYLYKYTDLEKDPEIIDYFIKHQGFDNTGIDEYITFLFEKATPTGEENNLPDGVLPDDIVKVAYLKNVPVENSIKIIDIANLKDPNNIESEGIIVNSDDYATTGNRIVFKPERSDYNPAIIIDYSIEPSGVELDYYENITEDSLLDYMYPPKYQPDKNFDSIFIVEYDYKTDENPRYLTLVSKLHNLGKKGSLYASN